VLMICGNEALVCLGSGVNGYGGGFCVGWVCFFVEWELLRDGAFVVGGICVFVLGRKIRLW